MPGSIEVLTGGMFSGKSDALIRRLRRALYAKQTIQVFKPNIDKRFEHLAVVSRTSARIEATPVVASQEILDQVSPDTCVVGIDEAQFLDGGVVDVCRILAAQGKKVLVAGLNMDASGNPFGPMPYLLAIADSIVKLSAICVRCGADAHFTQRLVGGADGVLVGDTDCYEARCRECFVPFNPTTGQG